MIRTIQEKVLLCLVKANNKLSISDIVERTGLEYYVTATALRSLRLRALVGTIKNPPGNRRLYYHLYKSRIAYILKDELTDEEKSRFI